MRIKLGVTIATSCSLGKNLFERHHTLIDEIKNEDSVVCAKKEKTILTAKKSQLEQYSTSQIPPLTKNDHDKAMYNYN